MKKNFIIVTSIIILTLFTTVSSAYALNITSSAGESWIAWNWDNNYTVHVYIDGVLTVENSTLGYFYLSTYSSSNRIQPNEQHIIELRNSTNPTEVLYIGQKFTTYPNLFSYIALTAAAIFAILGLILENPTKKILVGVSAATISLSVGLLSIAAIPLLTPIAWIITTLAGAIVAFGIYNYIKGNEEHEYD